MRTRQTLIDTLHTYLARDARVIALWLEGADATGWVDAYSDLDLCVSVDDGAMQAVTDAAQAALESLGPLDLVQRGSAGPGFAQTVFHLQDSSPYLLVDFNVYVGRGSQFVSDDPIERPLVLFDRGPVVTFASPTSSPQARATRLEELRQVVAQGARIEKYVLRGDFLEAFGYYHKWLLTPLIEALRMRYTPLHTDYYIVHISRHLPPPELARLEDLFQVGSLAELDAKRRLAQAFFDETAAALM
jgi:hypothetical protein